MENNLITIMKFLDHADELDKLAEEHALEVIRCRRTDLEQREAARLMEEKINIG